MKTGALPEERDSLSFTAFHLSLQLGFPSIATFLLTEYPPSTSEPSDAPPPGETLLSLAVLSSSPECVELVLELDETELDDVVGNWEWVEELLKGRGRAGEEKEKWEEVKWALAGKKGVSLRTV